MTKTVTTGKATDLITFTRSSTGTYLDSVKYGDELVTNGDFSNGTANWISTGGATATVSNNTIEVTWGGSGASQYYQAMPVVIGKTYLFSGKIDKVDATSSLFRLSNCTNLSLQPSSTEEETITAIFTATTTTLAVGLRVDGAGSSKFSNISVKEVIGNQGTSGEPLLRTADTNEPRIEYDADGNLKGLLIEEARTNILPQSIANANWGKIGVSITENFATAPDESSTAYKISETTTNSIHYAQQTNIQFTSGITYTESLIAKAGTNSVVQLLGTSSIFGSLAWANFDLSDGTIGSKGAGANAAIKPLGNGWYRCSLTMTATVNSSASAGFIILVPNKTYPRAPIYQGNSDNHIYAWGIQAETGLFPTSYIPTSGSTVTRTADYASVDISDFEINDNQSTILVTGEAATSDAGQVHTFISYSEGSSANRFLLYNNNGTMRAQIFSQSSTQAQLTNTATLSGSLALASKQDDVGFCVNGGTVSTDNSANMPINLTRFDIGSYGYASNHVNGHIKSVKYYPVRLTDNQLKALTQ